MKNPFKPSSTQSNNRLHPRNRKERQLEEYAQSYFKYTKILEEQAAVMREDVQELYAAHAKVSAEAAAEQKNLMPNEYRSSDQIQDDLKELERRCQIVPKSFEDRMRIILAANAYVRTMMDYVVGRAENSHRDRGIVTARGCQLLREDILLQKTDRQITKSSPIPEMTRSKVILTPTNKLTRTVSVEDIVHWLSDPNEIIGKAFISDEVVRRVFVVVDFAVKHIKGPQFDVVYEDSGLDEVVVVDPDTLKEMITDAELITNMTTI